MDSGQVKCIAVSTRVSSTINSTRQKFLRAKFYMVISGHMYPMMNIFYRTRYNIFLQGLP